MVMILNFAHYLYINEFALFINNIFSEFFLETHIARCMIIANCTRTNTRNFKVFWVYLRPYNIEKNAKKRLYFRSNLILCLEAF